MNNKHKDDGRSAMVVVKGNVKLENCHVSGGTQGIDGIRAYPGTTVTMSTSSANGGNGFSALNSLSNQKMATFKNCNATGNGGNGFDISSNASLDSCNSDGNGKHGYYERDTPFQQLEEEVEKTVNDQEVSKQLLLLIAEMRNTDEKTVLKKKIMEFSQLSGNFASVLALSITIAKSLM